jgi:hypothetical protein
MCGYNYRYICGYCLYTLHVYVFYYYSMNPCIYEMYFPVYVLYIMFRKSSVCIYFNCMQFEKFMWHSSVGFWICYSMFCRENESVLWCIVAWHGWSGMLHMTKERKPPIRLMESKTLHESQCLNRFLVVEHKGNSLVNDQ